MSAPILPGATLGVMGGGQLGRMFAIAARRLGYRVHSFSPDRDTPAGHVADVEICASYDDEAAVRAFAREVAVVTFEFENIPSQTIAWAAQETPVRPGGNVLHICQHRRREKEFLAAAGIPLPRFFVIESEADCPAALAHCGTPAVIKTAAFGYDGKGQRKLPPAATAADLADAWRSFGGQPAVLEAWVPFEKEISVLVARGLDGQTATYPVCENCHANHILDLTLSPAPLPDAVADAARALAVRIAGALDLVGLLAVEMFLLPDGGILINELAPRPHNSGHFSFDASATSQFEQQVRAICGLPLGSTAALCPSAMANLLGDIWTNGEPDWPAALALPGIKLHLYGKTDPRPGRKMGHLTALAGDLETAAKTALVAREALRRK